MNLICENIRKFREFKGFSQEYMASQLDINQASYAKIENNSTKLTVDRLFAISKLLETDITNLLNLKKQTEYNLYNNELGFDNKYVQNLYQENRQIYEKLIQAKDEQITLLKEMLKRNE